MPFCPYFSAFFLASLRISSATCLSRSSSVIVPVDERRSVESDEDEEAMHKTSQPWLFVSIWLNADRLYLEVT